MKRSRIRAVAELESVEKWKMRVADRADEAAESRKEMLRSKTMQPAIFKGRFLRGSA